MHANNLTIIFSEDYNSLSYDKINELRESLGSITSWEEYTAVNDRIDSMQLVLSLKRGYEAIIERYRELEKMRRSIAILSSVLADSLKNELLPNIQEGLQRLEKSEKNRILKRDILKLYEHVLALNLKCEFALIDARMPF